MDEIGLVCEELCKKVGKVTLFEGFCCEFAGRGLYLLMGESGCGKTTLLNMIYGNVEVDSGTVGTPDGEGCVREMTSWQREKMGYLLQTPYFVEYLTVGKNLDLCSQDRARIEELTELFGIDGCLLKYPRELSGGQKQRAALVRLLLQEKEILLLDEPTASLDGVEKEKIFRLLKELSESYLIICATHDRELMEYADDVIDLTEKEKYQRENKNRSGISDKEQRTDMEGSAAFKDRSVTASVRCVGKLFFNRMAQYRYPWREKRSGVILCLVFCFCLTLLFYVSDYRVKLDHTISHRYRLNGLRIAVDEDRMDEGTDILVRSGIKELLYDYGRNLPAEDMETGDSALQDVSYLSNAIVLPSQKEDFPYADDLVAGKYFTGKDQVILTRQYAQDNYGDYKKCVGSRIELELPDGKDDFEIVGIVDLSKRGTKEYFENVFYDDTGICMNGEYLKKYITDDVRGEMEESEGKIAFMAYFSSYGEVRDFLDRYQRDPLFEVTDYADSNVDLRIGTASSRMYYLPAVFFAFIFALLLYFQTRQIEMVQNESDYSVYLLCGYRKAPLFLATFLFYLADVSVRFGVSLVLTVLGTRVFDWFNSKYYLFRFELFAFDGKRVCQLLLLLWAAVCVLVVRSFRALKLRGWYQSLSQRRDLL